MVPRVDPSRVNYHLYVGPFRVAGTDERVGKELVSSLASVSNVLRAVRTCSLSWSESWTDFCPSSPVMLPVKETRLSIISAVLGVMTTIRMKHFHVMSSSFG